MYYRKLWWIAILISYFLEVACCQGNYFYLGKNAKKGTTIGRFSVVENEANISIVSTTYYRNVTGTPVAVANDAWKKPLEGNVAQTDCAMAEKYLFPRNLFCVEYATGRLFTTAEYAKLNLVGGSSFVLGIYADKNGRPIFKSPQKVTIRITPNCSVSSKTYLPVSTKCFSRTQRIISATSTNNGSFFYSPPSNYNLTGIDVNFGHLATNSLTVGNKLHFTVILKGEISEFFSFERILLINPSNENVTFYRLDPPVRTIFTSSMEIKLKDNNNKELSGTKDTLSLTFIPFRSYCDEEVCLIPLSNWLKSDVIKNDQECAVLVDTNYLLPKYEVCLGNNPPVASPLEDITLVLPTAVGQVLRKINAKDPENTNLTYKIISVTLNDKAFPCNSELKSPACPYFRINSLGELMLSDTLQGKHRDKYKVLINIKDGGSPSRSLALNQSIILQDKCGKAIDLYSNLTSITCLPLILPIPPYGTVSNVTQQTFLAQRSVYKVIEGKIDITKLNISTSGTQSLTVKVTVSDRSTNKMTSSKYVRVSISTGIAIYSVYLNLRINFNMIIKINIFQNIGGSDKLLTLQSETIFLYPYHFRQYCNKLNCLATYKKWKESQVALKTAKVEGCDTDPRFAETYFKDCFGSPTIKKNDLPEIKTKTGSIQAIRCGYFSFSTASVSWMKDGKLFTNFIEPQKRRRRRRKRAVLLPTPFQHADIYVRMTPEMQGRFQCLVTNRYAKVRSNHTVVRLTDVLTSKLNLHVTNKVFNEEFKNVSSEKYKKIEAEIKDALLKTFDARGGAKTSVTIDKLSPGSLVVDASIYTSDITGNNSRTMVCSDILLAGGKSTLGTLEIDREKSKLNFFDCCNASTSGFADEQGIFKWPATASDVNAKIPCPYGNKKGSPGNATRMCMYKFGANAQWAIPNTTVCKYLSPTTEALEQLSQIPLSKVNILNVSSDLVNLTKDPKELKNRQDIKFATKTIENIIKTDASEGSIATNIVKTTSNLMEGDKKIISKSQFSFRTSTRMLKAIQLTADAVRLTNTILFFSQGATNLALFAGNIGNLAPNGVMITVEKDDSTNTTNLFNKQFNPGTGNQETLGSVFIPKEALQKAYRITKNPRVTSLFFRNSKLFADRGSVVEAAENKKFTTTKSVNSYILDATLSGRKIDNFGSMVETSFRPLAKNVKGNLSCVFWDFKKAAGSGAWSSKGCSELLIENGLYKCSCNHLTHFAVLLDVSSSTTSSADEKALHIISYIGCAISLAALLVTILTFAMFGDLRKKLPPKILICLSVSLLALLITFVAGIDKTSPRVGCQIVAICLHYFLLTTFLWMGVEAYNLYWSFVIVIGSRTSMFLRKVSLVAWGVPLIIVAISAGVGIEDYGNERNCMVSGLPFYIGLVLPIGLLLLINFVIFGFVIRGLRSDRNLSKDKKMDAFTMARIGIACSVLLGLTWILAFFAVDDLRLPFQYLFCIVNSLQGLFIFIFYCARNNDVRREWKKRLCAKRKDQSSSHSKNISSNSKKDPKAQMFSDKDKRKSGQTESTVTSGNAYPMEPVKIAFHVKKTTDDPISDDEFHVDAISNANIK